MKKLRVHPKGTHGESWAASDGYKRQEPQRGPDRRPGWQARWDQPRYRRAAARLLYPSPSPRDATLSRMPFTACKKIILKF